MSASVGLTLPIITAEAVNAKVWRRQEVQWPDLLDWAARPALTRECGGYVLGTFLTSERTLTSLASRSALTLDADKALPELPDHVKALGWLALAHTTWSHTRENPRWRFILPTDRPITADEYHKLTSILCIRLGRGQFDVKASRNPVQFMFRPAANVPADYRHHEFSGPLLPTDEVLGWMTDEQVRAEIPAANVRSSRRKQPPTEIGGVAGEFNRAYPDLDELIERFELPYFPVGNGRYILDGSHAQPGFGELPDQPGLYYSHHANDPACDQAVGGFDLVRLHRFGEMDSHCPESTPINRRPSHQAMIELCSGDERIAKLRTVELVERRARLFDDLDELDDEAEIPASQVEDNEWLGKLERSERSGKVLDTPGNLMLIRRNDKVMRGIFYDVMRDEILLTRRAWGRRRNASMAHTEADTVFLAERLGVSYGIKLSKDAVFDMIVKTAQENAVNSLTDLLDTLVWDGTERLETALPVAEHNDYTRAAARMFFLGAVARAYDPGVKFDYCLVMQGGEGLGKTRFVNAVGLESHYVAQLGDITTKDTLMQLRRTWIMHADETSALRKADSERLKSFLTEQYDNYRAPYDRRGQEHPRRCVFVATTNDPYFLSEQVGNRRFLIVRVDEVPDELLDREYLLQVWAEAVFRYRVEQERIYLTHTEEAMARDARDVFTHNDPLYGRVLGYLEMEVPENWETMGTRERASWVASDRLVAPSAGKMNRACVAAIWAEVIVPNSPRQCPEFEARRIEAALRAAPGWAEIPGRTDTELYGPQRVFARLT